MLDVGENPRLRDKLERDVRIDEAVEVARGRVTMPGVGMPPETDLAEEWRDPCAVLAYEVLGSSNSGGARCLGAAMREVQIQTELSLAAKARRRLGPAGVEIVHAATRTGSTGRGPFTDTLGRNGMTRGGSVTMVDGRESGRWMEDGGKVDDDDDGGH